MDNLNWFEMPPAQHSDVVPVIAALIGLLGVLIGIVITEYLNRRKRVEFYSQKVFEKRLEVYETLMKFSKLANDVATQILIKVR